eukprot:15483258-Alexandrium_andersonii.AAC.1
MAGSGCAAALQADVRSARRRRGADARRRPGILPTSPSPQTLRRTGRPTWQRQSSASRPCSAHLQRARTRPSGAWLARPEANSRPWPNQSIQRRSFANRPSRTS